MNHILFESLQGQLLHRREALTQAIDEVGQAKDLVALLTDVDRALRRLGTNAYGQCVVCEGWMDDEEMLGQPTRQYCLCDLSTAQRDSLQRDLDLAWQVQVSLLPDQDIRFAGWQAHYRYLPAGPVSGDYCDVIPQESDGGWLYFLVGDVAGKGVAASYLMAHVSALVRRTLDEPVPVSQVLATVNRHLLERSADHHFVTLVSGRANRDGVVELCNAGHCPPIILREGKSEQVGSSSLPLGIDSTSDFSTAKFSLGEGESLILYTDGLSEARNDRDEQFGAAGLARVACDARRSSPAQLAAACLQGVRAFQNGAPQQDDMTWMVVRRSTV